MNGPDLETLKRYFSLMNFNGAAQVYHAAVASGVLDTLGRQPLSHVGLSEACGTQPRPTQLLLIALKALGLVEHDSETQDGEELRWQLTDLARMLLWGQYRDLGNQYWTHLPDFLSTGRPLKRMDSPVESEAHYQSQAAALGWMLAPAAEASVGALGIGHKRRGLAILDVGAGSGIWSLTIVRRDPETTVTAVDWPGVLQVARETAQNFGVQDALTTLEGNYHQVELPSQAFDLAIVANVTHLETPEGNAALFGRLYAALKPHGEIAVVDVLPTSAHTELATSLYQLGLALRTEQGQVYAASELVALLQSAGFGPAELIPLEAPPHLVGMLLAQKPNP